MTIIITCVIAGLFDPVKETDRLRKQEAKVQKALAGLQGRLANRRFLDNAAPAVVQEVKQQQVGYWSHKRHIELANVAGQDWQHYNSAAGNSIARRLWQS